MKSTGCRTGKTQYARKADLIKAVPGAKPKKCDACRHYHDQNEQKKGRRR